jgi:hypothetical protein
LFTGGWAGGEAGLWVAREEFKKEVEASKTKQSTVKEPPKKVGKSSPWSKNGEPIYVGFGKDELDLKSSGAMGRVIYDSTLFH